jgi:uncharacterized RmlC-like cupin family protein
MVMIESSRLLSTACSSFTPHNDRVFRCAAGEGVFLRWLQVLAPGARTPVHSHDCEEVFLVEAGRATCVFQNRRTLLQERLVGVTNNTIIIPPHVKHQILNGEARGDLEYMVVFSNPPMDITVYEGWDDPRGEHRGLHVFDQSCPLHGPGIR